MNTIIRKTEDGKFVAVTIYEEPIEFTKAETIGECRLKLAEWKKMNQNKIGRLKPL